MGCGAQSAVRHRIFAKLTNDLASHSEYAAACLIEGSAHGYDVQNLLLQSRDGTIIRRQWLGVNETNETNEPVASVELNLVAEIQAFRESQFGLRDAGFVNDDIGGTPGRYLHMYLVTAQDGEWLSCPGPLFGHTYKNNSVTRIYRAMWGIALA